MEACLQETNKVMLFFSSFRSELPQTIDAVGGLWGLWDVLWTVAGGCGLWDMWIVGHVDCETCGLQDMWTVGHAGHEDCGTCFVDKCE